jgi:uroporphyrinogen decarboxylase
MTPREVLFEVLAHRTVRPVPYTIGLEGDLEARLDAHYGHDDWRAQLTPYITTVSAVDTNAKDVIDALHVRDPYGAVWRVDKLPWHLAHCPLADPYLDGYNFPSPEAFYRPEQKAQGMTIRERYPDSFIVGGLGWGLFERSWTLRGFENVLMDAVENPEFFEALLDHLLELYLAFIDYTADLPIDGILFGDDWGDQRGVILGPERWRHFLKPRWATLFARVHAHGKVTMCHSCGSVETIIPDLIEIGLDVLESVQPEAANMNPFELKRKYGKNITFWGCLGSQQLIPFGTPEEITQEIHRLSNEMGEGGGFIMAPAKPLQPETPTANAIAIIEAFRNQPVCGGPG